ncbi:hypothetical protein GF340_02905 [Candidatus Peregrinibacteria bacterium]|nr:hypothetical protein [Candidatus Peregrinibacteria bacterium]
MKKLQIIIAIIALSSLAFFLSACGPAEQVKNDEKVVIAATIPPLADLAKQIIGDEGEAYSVIDAGASPHTFEMAPSDAVKLETADMVLKIGHGLDNWLIEDGNLGINARIVTVDEGIDFLMGTSHDHEHEDDHEDEDEKVDPHYWLSPKNAMMMGKNIRDELSASFPEKEPIFTENYNSLITSLENLDKEIHSKLAGLENRKMIVFHDSWNYLAKDYNLEIAAVFEPSAGKEPTPQQLAELYEVAQNENINVIFSEPQFSNQTIRALVEDLNLELLVLDPLGGDTFENRDTYEELLMYNANTIYEGLSK